MANIIRSLKKRFKHWLIDRMFLFHGGDYQGQRYPKEKIDRIMTGVDLARVGSVLDIGCNEGLITKHFSEQGKFCVGIDVAPYFLRGVLQDLHRGNTPAFGVFNLERRNIELLPPFDLVLLLSVHHWWVKAHGDAHARDMVAALLDRTNHYLVMEFSSIADKYGYSEPKFIDHDESSIKEYASAWLKQIDSTLAITYLGRNRETEGRERFRYIFLVSKSGEGETNSQ